ncbi:ubiquitin-related modifier 1 isoform X1 [Phoca vitulina]|uniref:ubiquitin-related modifier 1 isoform X1 n=1 Tax=Phoca vitulina TaxID=9720 RepID=UPI001396253F|nr:ubiquitin-related modifier 1 isoform X1 [Phoca vitulina]
MSGNRGASPVVEVLSGHSSVPCALPDPKGVTRRRGTPFRRRKETSGHLTWTGGALGHPEPPCLDQEEFAERAARIVHPGRQRPRASGPVPDLARPPGKRATLRVTAKKSLCFDKKEA